MAASISEYVLKVHSRCDLACDHCYVYEHADRSWRSKPKALDEATAAQAARRIAEHAAAHRLSQVHVVLHGGEPLLLGRAGLHAVLRALRSAIDPVTDLDLRIHTNGVRLDPAICALFADFDVKVGVSLDGDRPANDRHRTFAGGRSSHHQVRQALALLRRREYRHLYAGLLCTIDVANDPIRVYEALLAEDPPRLDLLLPHATWDRPPPRRAGQPTPYADWLGRIHARWVADGRPVPIRFFDSLASAWAGRGSWSEAAGLDAVDLLVIETDGSWEQTDSLKTAFDGAPATGLTVFSHSVDEAAAHPGVAARRDGLAALCPECRGCPLVRACGGGLYAHRYRSGTGFNNPSVYCDDLKVLIPQVTAAPAATTASTTATANGQATLSPRQAGPSRRHQLPPGAFDLLAAGPGDRAAMACLADAQASVSRALVAKVAARRDTGDGTLARAATAGWALLSALDRQHPRAVREVLTYPYVQAWAKHCVDLEQPADVEFDRAHLAGLAAAAAVRAGVDTELVLPVRNGAVYLPGIGALRVPAADRDTTALRVTPDWPRGQLGWQPVRCFNGAGLSITVEDVDPFRDCQDWPATGRLPPAQWRDWQRALAAAASQLSIELPSYAAVLSAGLRAVVPLSPDPAGAARSGTARHAFGGLAVALPPDVSTLSELLLHEMQHVKLAALSDLFDLFDPADDRLMPVGWRADLRPTEGALQGTYAFLALAELCRARAQGRSGEAQEQFLRYRSWVSEAIETLLDAGTLAPDGVRFVLGMRASVRTWT